MKNILNHILILLIGFIAFGCEDFLDEAPVSSISTLGFFQNEDQFLQAVNASYTDLRTLAGSGLNHEGTFWAFGEMRSDNSTFQDNDTDLSGHRFWHLDQFTMNSQNEIPQTAWNACYSGIGKCNTVLEYIDNIEFDMKSRFIGEVRFLRALYYFTLVRHFGDVPLVTETAKSYVEAFDKNKRVAADLIYDQMLEDLNYAKQNLPLSYAGNDLGRATEGAARKLLAKVLMYRGRYADAIPELTAIVNSQQYAVLDDYASVFDINNENNAEMVFSVQFVDGPYGLGNANMYRFLPWNSAVSLLPLGQYTARTGMNIPSTNLINSFEEGDLRKEMIEFSYIDHQFGTHQDSIVPYSLKQMHPGHAERPITRNNFPLFRYPHVLLSLAECYVREGGGDPVPLVNQVRIRAGLPAVSSVTLDEILHERRVEFHCEADRWDVLMRTGRMVEVMTAFGQEQRTLHPIVHGPRTYVDLNPLYPIPAAVLSNDPTMQQNPGY